MMIWKHTARTGVWRSLWLLIVGLGLLTLLPPQPAQAVEDPTPLEVTLKELGYGDFSLRGMYGSTRLWIPLRSDWKLQQDVTLEVTYIASPLLRPRSTLTLYANDTELISIRPIADGQPHTFTAKIPVSRLQGEGIVLDFQGYLRLTDDPCEETNNPGQWIRILTRQTKLSLAPTWRPAEPDLERLASAMVVRDAREYNQDMPPLVFVLPDEPTPTELTVAGQVAARLSAEAGTVPPIHVLQASQAEPEGLGDAQVILVGTPERLPWLNDLGKWLPAPWWEDTYRDAQGVEVPADQGVIQVTQAPKAPHRYLLLVSGTSEEGLRRAGEAFARPSIFRALTGEFLFVGDQPPQVEPVPPLPWSTETTSFAQLGARDRRVNGLGAHNLFYYFRRPPGWVLDKESKLILRFVTSPALTSRESYIAVFINDVPVGAVRTGPDFPTEATLELPIARLNRDLEGRVLPRLTVRLEVGNFAREVDCEQVHPEASWTIVQADSYFELPHVYFALPDLQAFPYPFAAVEEDMPPTWILVPPNPQPQEIAQSLSLASLLALYTPRDLTTQILPGDAVTEADLADPHLIVLGDRERQPWVTRLLEEMGTVPGYRGERGLYKALRSPKQGLLREGPSPWNPDRVVLMAFGTTPEGAAHAADALLNQTPPVDEPGSVALVDEWGRTRVIYRSTTQPPVPESNRVLREPALPAPEPWVIITGIMVASLLVILGIIAWVRWRYRIRE